MMINRLHTFLFILFQASATVFALQTALGQSANLRRSVTGPFPINSTGEVLGPLGIEHQGLAKVIFNVHRPKDSFILNGQILSAVDRNGSCYVNPDTFHLHCEDIPENIQQSATKFTTASNGTILFKNSANWWACPAQNPDTYDVYFHGGRRKPSPYCKYIKLRISSDAAARKRSETFLSSTFSPRTCPFTTTFELDIPHDAKQNHMDLGPFLLNGKALMAGPQLSEYCFVESTSRRLLCRDKASTTLIDNWHKINFSIDDGGKLRYDNSDAWFVCLDHKDRLIGPFDSAKKSDPLCASEMRRVHLKVQHFLNKDQQSCSNDWQSIKSSQDLSGIFHPRAELRHKREATPTNPGVSCPTNLVNTLFKSPTLVVPVVSTQANQSFGIVRNITLTPVQKTVFKFFVPFTTPYYGKTCSLLLLIPDVQYLRVDPQTLAPALDFFALDGQINETTTWKTLPPARLLATKKMPQEVKVGQDNSIVTFPCDAGQFKSLMVASKGGLSLSIKQDGVPNESGLHIVPCV